jgi:hypothetical protein
MLLRNDLQTDDEHEIEITTSSENGCPVNHAMIHSFSVNT